MTVTGRAGPSADGDELVVVAARTARQPVVLSVGEGFALSTRPLSALIERDAALAPAAAAPAVAAAAAAPAVTAAAPSLPRVAEGGRYVADLPWVLRGVGAGWVRVGDGREHGPLGESVDHERDRVALGGRVLAAVAQTAGPMSAEVWLRTLAGAVGQGSPTARPVGEGSPTVFEQLLAGRFIVAEADSRARVAEGVTQSMGHSARAYAATLRAVDGVDLSGAFVVGIYGDASPLVPASLGSLLGYLRRHLNADERVGCVVGPVCYVPLGRARRWAQRLPERSVVLLSDYVWSAEENTVLARAIREAAPSAIIVRGGPQFPARDHDQAAFAQEVGDSVDLGVVGEGEQALLEVVRVLLAAGGPRAAAWRSPRALEACARVPGVVYIDGPTVTRGPAPERLADLGQLASAYLDGSIDVAGLGLRCATVETNRGCPYGCTFCDWGSATLSRIRSRPLDEVLAELTHVVESGVEELLIADANFGILARDVQIAEHLAGLRRRVGRPHSVVINYAKNVHRNLLDVFEVFDRSSITIPRTLARQTIDSDVLAAVHRSNIKVEAYDALAAQLVKSGPIRSEFIVGLPGATFDSTVADVQFCFDRNLVGAWYRPLLLVNSPMNAPEYREQYAIEADATGHLCATSSYTREDFAAMMRLVQGYQLIEVLGIGRYLVRVLAEQIGDGQTGVGEARLLAEVGSLLHREPRRWPNLALLWLTMAEAPAAQWPWPAALAELIDVCDTRWGGVRGPAIDMALRAQVAVLPGSGPVPRVVELDHDIVGWWRSRLAGARRRLVEFDRGTLHVQARSRTVDGGRGLSIGYQLEFDSELSGAFPLAIVPETQPDRITVTTALDSQ